MASPISCHGKVDDVEAGEDDLNKYMRLYRAAAEGNWEEAEKFLSQHSHDAIHAPLNYRSETALHLAAKAGAASMAKKLVEMLSADNILRLRTHKGLTALHVAAKFGNTEVAEILVGYNHNLLYQSCDKGLFPIHYAACNTRNSKDVFLYFSAQTKDDAQPNPYAGQSGATILVNLITSKFYDVALELIYKCPDLTHHLGDPLVAMVEYNYTRPTSLHGSIPY